MEVTTTEAPFALQLVVWVGVFSGVVWGLMALFRDRSPPPPVEPIQEESED